MKITGHSDDLIHVEDHDRADEYNDDCLRFTVGDKAGGVVVVMEYANAKVTDQGCWHATFCQLGEDIPIPWPVRVEVGSSGYSVEAVIGCPKETPLLIERRDNDVRWVRLPADLRRQALAKLTPEEIEALGIES